MYLQFQIKFPLRKFIIAYRANKKIIDNDIHSTLPEESKNNEIEVHCNKTLTSSNNPMFYLYYAMYSIKDEIQSTILYTRTVLHRPSFTLPVFL